MWIASANGAGARELALGDEAVVSPNGQYIAVQHFSSKGSSLEIYGSDGRELAHFYDAAKDSATPLAWSPSSRYLAVSLESTAAVGRGALTVVDTSTMRSRVLATGEVEGAGFNPTSSQLAYGISRSLKVTAPVRLYTVPVSGAARSRELTTGFSPVWVAGGIVFSRSRWRGASRAPIFQLWLDSSGKLRQLTHMRVPALLDGLTALSASTDGNRLIANYTGEDTSEAYTVQLSPLRVKLLKVNGQTVQPYGISRSGQRLLVDVGAFENPPNDGVVESVSFSGGDPVKLARGAEPSWTG